MNKTAKSGDKISAMGITITIGTILYQDYDHWDDCWDIEFLDPSGKYHHWKQCFDGGKLVPT